MSATLNGASQTQATGLLQLGQREHGFDRLIHEVPGEALGMLILHHRDEALRLKKTRRSHGMSVLTPIGNDAQIRWHESLMAELRLEAERRDTESAV